MFWVILTIICIILFIIAIFKDIREDWPVIIMGTGIITMCITFGTGLSGTTDYRYLKGKLSGIEALQNRIQDVKNSIYTYKKDGTFIAGSIENMNQSTNLSKYIVELAVKESKYKSYLQECIITKETFLLSFFGTGWTISDKIYELPTTL